MVKLYSIFVFVSGPQVKCQLTTVRRTLNVTDERGIACVSPPDFTLTTCSGSCDSWDLSPVRFKDTGVEISHTHECKCCSGVGTYEDVDLLCGVVTRTVQVMQFAGCSCKACVEGVAPSIAGSCSCSEQTLCYLYY